MQFSPNFNSGWIEVICGSMFSGKTEELIRRVRRAQIAKQKVQIFKPIIDHRYSLNHVTSHSELQIQAQKIRDPEEILTLLEDNTRIVAVDEAQFLSSVIVDLCHRMANRGLRVIVAGLDLDYKGMPFGPMPFLMATAEIVTKMSAICTICGNNASRTQRRPNIPENGPVSSEQIVIGAESLYEARCRRCYEPPR